MMRAAHMCLRGFRLSLPPWPMDMSHTAEIIRAPGVSPVTPDIHGLWSWFTVSVGLRLRL